MIEHLLDHPLHVRLLGVELAITKHTLMLWVAGGLLLALSLLVLRRPPLVPRGLYHPVEVMVLYFREQIVRPLLQEETDRYLPYILTLFFFILFANLLGLVPGASTATSNINVTATLAVITFLYVQWIGIRHQGLLGYLRSFIPHGVPFYVVPILIPVEIISHLARPFSLSIRLFANMTGGHIIILVLLGFIFISKSFWVAPISVAGAVAISAFEIFVAFIQAFIFAFLTTIYISGSLRPAH